MPSPRSSTYHQIARKDLQDFGSKTGSSREDFLKNLDQKMTHRSADEGTIDGHFGHSGIEVVTMLALIVCNPR